MSNKKVIDIILANIAKHNPDFAASNELKLEAGHDAVKLLVRAKPTPETTTPNKSFPSHDKVNADIAAAIPHEKGLTRSAVYTVESDEKGVAQFCRCLGRKYCITKDQPRQEGYIRFRVFAHNKPGFRKPAKMGGGGSV